MRAKRWVFRSKIILFEWKQHYFEFIQLSLVVYEMIITAEKKHWHSETEKKKEKKNRLMQSWLQFFCIILYLDDNVTA